MTSSTSSGAEPAGCFIDGAWVEPLSGAVRTVINPANGRDLARVAAGDASDADRAVDAARRALPEWLETTPGERSEMLLSLAAVTAEHAEDLAQIESRNAGKPREAARSEIAAIVDSLRFFAGAARCLEGRAAGEYARGYTSMLRREAVGVVGAIVPWNYPLATAVAKLAPALAAGNTVVLKPADLTPLSVLRLAELAREIFPPGVFNVVTGSGSVVGAALVRHPNVDMITFTGDGTTGRMIAREAADTLKRVQLELGGKAPAIVFEDADVTAAAAVIRDAGFWNAGQDCGAACRVLVAREIHDRLADALSAAAEAIRVGDPESGEDIEMGPVISSRHQEQILGSIERAVAEGGEVLTGGETDGREGFFVKPTVFVGVEQQSEIIQREVFGPVITIQPFDGPAEALRLAGDVPYGLAASVFTSNVGRALEFARKLRFGTVWINDHLPAVSEMPWGGFGQSGYGNEQSLYALDEHTQVKHVMARLGS